MAIRLIVSDCDGTLLDDQKQVDAGLLPLMQELQKRSVGFTLASGRNIEIIMPYAKQLGITLPMIANGGAQIHDGQRFLFQRSISKHDQRQIIELLETHQIRSVYYAQDHAFTRYADEVNEYFIRRLRGNIPLLEAESSDCISNEELFKIVIVEPNSQKLADIQASINQLQDTHCLLAEENLCTITHRLASKGQALMTLIEWLKITPQEVLVIGDNHNDLSMFELFEHSAAVANAEAEVKAKARYLTTDNNHQGVSTLIHRLLSENSML